MRHAPLRLQLDEVSGDQPSVLLLHSSGVTGRAWYPILRALDGRRHALAPTFLGYGKNPRVHHDTAFSVHDDLELLEQILLAQPEPIDLIGHSYGGWLALQLAARNPDRVRQVIAHEPALWGVLYSAGTAADVALFESFDDGHDMFVDDLAGTDRWMKRFVDFWSGNGTWDQFTARRQRAQLDVGWKIYEEVRHACHDRTPHTAWAKLEMPVRLTVGEHSPPLERRVLELLIPHLQQGSLVQIEGGHMAPVTHPGGLLPHLLSWLGVQASHTAGAVR